MQKWCVITMNTTLSVHRCLYFFIKDHSQLCVQLSLWYEQEGSDILQKTVASNISQIRIKKTSSRNVLPFLSQRSSRPFVDKMIPSCVCTLDLHLQFPSTHSSMVKHCNSCLQPLLIRIYGTPQKVSFCIVTM